MSVIDYQFVSSTIFIHDRGPSLKKAKIPEGPRQKVRTFLKKGQNPGRSPAKKHGPSLKKPENLEGPDKKTRTFLENPPKQGRSRCDACVGRKGIKTGRYSHVIEVQNFTSKPSTDSAESLEALQCSTISYKKQPGRKPGIAINIWGRRFYCSSGASFPP